MTQVGDYIRIIDMSGEPQYAGRHGRVERIDGIGQLHGTWGGLAVIPGEDSFETIAIERTCKTCQNNGAGMFTVCATTGMDKDECGRCLSWRMRED